MITDYGVKGLLYKALAATPQSDKIANLAQRVMSTLPAGAAEKLDFLGMVPALRRWVGNRSAKKPNEYHYTVTTDKFEGTIDLPMDWINNDKTGQVARAASQLVTRYNPQWAGARVANLINNSSSGTLGLCFDGLSFINASHVWGDSGTINNAQTFGCASAGNPTANEAANAIVKAFQTLVAFKDDRGEPINENITKVAIVVPGGNATIAAAVLQACTMPNLDTGTGVRVNPVMGLPVEFEVISSVRVTLTNRMHLYNVSPDAVPFAFLENKADFRLTSKAAGSDYEHDNDAWQYGVKAVGEAGYGRFTDVVEILFN